MRHDAVFLGAVSTVNEQDGKIVYVLDVARWWKGPGTATATIVSDGSNCEHQYIAGSTYIVFANGGGPFSTTLCSSFGGFLLEDGQTHPVFGNVEEVLDVVVTRFNRVAIPMTEQARFFGLTDTTNAQLPLGSLSGFVVDYVTGEPVDLVHGGYEVMLNNEPGYVFPEMIDYPIKLNYPELGQFRADSLIPGEHRVIVVGGQNVRADQPALIFGEDRLIDVFLDTSGKRLIRRDGLSAAWLHDLMKSYIDAKSALAGFVFGRSHVKTSLSVEASPRASISMVVSDSWKGMSADTVDINSNCDGSLTIHQEHLIFAETDLVEAADQRPTLQLDSCPPSRVVALAYGGRGLNLYDAKQILGTIKLRLAHWGAPHNREEFDEWIFSDEVVSRLGSIRGWAVNQLSGRPLDLASSDTVLVVWRAGGHIVNQGIGLNEPSKGHFVIDNLPPATYNIGIVNGADTLAQKDLLIVGGTRFVGVRVGPKMTH